MLSGLNDPNLCSETGEGWDGGHCEQHQWRYEDCAKRQCQKNLKRLIGELHSMSVKGIAVSVSDCGKKSRAREQAPGL